MNKETRKLLTALLAVILLIGIFGVLYIRYYLITPYQGYTESAVAITIPPGSSIDSICNMLDGRGVIRYSWLLKGIFIARHTQGQSKAGDYVFNQPLSPLDVYEKLLKGEIFYNVVTIPEGSTSFEIGTLLVAKGIASAQEFQHALHSPEVLAALHLIDASIFAAEGFLFPDTYFLGKKDDPKKLILMMLSQFRKYYGPAEKARAGDLNMTTPQMITLASLIEKETGRPAERPLISGVFHNRLQKSMLLQCDPTIIYAMKLSGEYDGTILRKDLERDSPYNTYLHTGLPPGPICNPGSASIHAALYPQQTAMLYFVSKNDGTHYFSATLQEHNRAVQQYQRN